MNEQIDIESLIVKYLNNTITDGEYHQLTLWMKQSEENELVFNQIREMILVSKLNDKEFQFDVQAALDRIRKNVRYNKPMPRYETIKPRRGITISYRQIAAIILLMIVCGGFFYYRTRLPVENAMAVYQEIKVPLGSRSDLILPDGSHVTLNAGTTLRYHMGFGMESRDLWLDGEGYFIVRKSATPFIVHSGSVQVKAVGTSFNVRAYASEDKIETTLVEGKVKITDTKNNREHAEEITLLPNQKLTVSKTGGKSVAESAANPSSNMELQERIDPIPEISWKDNKWVIYRENLGSLAVRLERRFDIKIVFTDEQLKSFRYNGSLPDLSLEQVLNAMSAVSPIHYSVNGKIVTFSENKNYQNNRN